MDTILYLPRLELTPVYHLLQIMHMISFPDLHDLIEKLKTFAIWWMCQNIPESETTTMCKDPKGFNFLNVTMDDLDAGFIGIKGIVASINYDDLMKLVQKLIAIWHLLSNLDLGDLSGFITAYMQ